MPHTLLVDPPASIRQDPSITPEGFILVDLEIQAGVIRTIRASGGGLAEASSDLSLPNSVPVFDLDHQQVWPCFVDLHTHLDKGHIWPRCPNPTGTFNQALEATHTDRQQHWKPEDLYRRMQFGLQCSYAHGTQAIRTHLDALEGQAEISLEVLTRLRQEWQDRLILQAVALVPLEVYLTSVGETLADQFAEIGFGVLGGVAFPHPDLEAQIARVIELAHERQLDLDFHTDESGNPQDRTLYAVAQAVVRHQFPGRVICGHCCSLAVQSPAVASETLDCVAAAGIGIVSLPLCNLYLQDRNPGHTPTWRGVTLLHEIQQRGIPVSLASDNCRDPFHGFGDHDVFEVFNLSTRIAHLDTPYSTWPRSVTSTPADQMGLAHRARIGVGYSADLIVFHARYFSELLSRPQADRIVLRKGHPIDTTLPDYRDLDSLFHQGTRS